jgi:hypothetical protein
MRLPVAAIPISAEFADQLKRDGDSHNIVADVDGVTMLMLAAPNKKKKKGKQGGKSGTGSSAQQQRREPVVPMSRAERRQLKSKQRKLDGLEVGR